MANKIKNEIVVAAFKGQLTDYGINELKERFPAGLVIDMRDDINFKAARKTRTERNALVKAISERRISIASEINALGKELASTVTDIYSVVVDPFEAEDNRRKEVAAEEARKLQVRLDNELKEINSIRDFISSANLASSDEVSGMVDAVGNITVDHFHKDNLHNALAVIQEVKNTLSEILVNKIESERANEERKKAIEAQKIADENAKVAAKKIAELEVAAKNKQRQDEENSIIQSRIDTLKMIPIDFIGENSEKISSKLLAISKVVINEQNFGVRINEVSEEVKKVVESLTRMLDNAKKIEEFDQVKVEEEKKVIADEIEPVTKVQDDTPEVITTSPEVERSDKCNIPTACLKEVANWAIKANLKVHQIESLEDILNKYFS